MDFLEPFLHISAPLRFMWDIREGFCTGRLVRHWSRLPRIVVESLSLEVFKRCVNVILRDGFSDGPGSAGLMVGPDPKGIFQPK